jgi:hypothetical protein
VVNTALVAVVIVALIHQSIKPRQAMVYDSGTVKVIQQLWRHITSYPRVYTRKKSQSPPYTILR